MKMLIEQRAVMNVDGKEYEVFRNKEESDTCMMCDLFDKCRNDQFENACDKINGGHVYLTEVKEN